jgi:hypothetical protein
MAFADVRLTLPSLDHGGPEARLRSASRILGQSAYDSVVTSL